MLRSKLMLVVILFLSISRNGANNQTTPKNEPTTKTVEKANWEEHMKNNANATFLEDRRKLNSLNGKLDAALSKIQRSLSSSTLSKEEREILEGVQNSLNYAKSIEDIEIKEKTLQNYEYLESTGLINLLGNKNEKETVEKEKEMIEQLNSKLYVSLQTIQSILNSNLKSTADRLVLQNLEAILINAEASANIKEKKEAIDTFDIKFKDFGILYLSGDEKNAENDDDEDYDDFFDSFFGLLGF